MPGHWFGFLARSGASPSIVGPLTEILSFIALRKKKNIKGAPVPRHIDSDRFFSPSSRMFCFFFIPQKAHGLFSPSSVWMAGATSDVHTPFASQLMTQLLSIIPWCLQSRWDFLKLKWTGRTRISPPPRRPHTFQIAAIKMPLKGTVPPQIVRTSYLLQHAVSFYVVVRKVAEQSTAPDQLMNKSALRCRTCSILTAYPHI